MTPSGRRRRIILRDAQARDTLLAFGIVAGGILALAIALGMLVSGGCP